MFRHILVPLDGSRLAEAALPVAATLASKLGASLTLVHVIERDAPEQVHHERHLTTVTEAIAYLERVARESLPGEVKAQTHVHTAAVTDVARSIVAHTHELEPDLIVMCTHGRAGPRDILFGSIAQQVIALGATPVLLVQPEAPSPGKDLLCSTILVPLDTDPEHARALPIAAELARPCGASLLLMTVVPTAETLAGQQAATARLLPGAMRAALDLDQAAAETYVQEQAKSLAPSTLEVTVESARGDPATEIVRAAERARVGLIVMAVHGTLGTQAFWARSVPPKVSSRSSVPVLLVPIRR
ncbi:MAG: universal stress protein [Chloroflexi bacterium]|nr:universal stress protein [Chloroflexota bacterium]